MDRLPFDPKRMKTRGADESRSDDGPLTVSQLASKIRETLERALPASIRVVGEVSNLSMRNHWYFSLKDGEALVSCVAWASSVRRFATTPADGDQVIVTGHVGHYEPQGRTQFYVTAMQAVGEGALQLQFRQRCDELRELGYFDPERKKRLPLLPARVAVISSASGAAIHDVIDTAKRRCASVRLLLVDARMQGEGSAASVAAAIRRVDRERAALGVEAIIVTRGGGSIEDLWAFNERIVADATYACTLPLVAAIGHESDTTIIELVADHRAATPTQAAMHVVPSGDELRQQLDHFDGRLRLLLKQRIELARRRLDALARCEVLRDPRAIAGRLRDRVERCSSALRRAHSSRVFAARARVERSAAALAARGPEAVVNQRRQRLAVAAERLRGASRAALGRHRDWLTSADRSLRLVDPRAILTRGFTYTTDSEGRILRSAGAARRAGLLRTHFADGEVDSRTEGSRRSRPRSGVPERDQLDLFDGEG